VKLVLLVAALLIFLLGAILAFGVVAGSISLFGLLFLGLACFVGSALVP
jgi:hypothetical protein